MSATVEAGSAVEWVLDCCDAVIAAYSRNNVPAVDAISLSALCSYNKSVRVMYDAWGSVLRASGDAETAAHARGWLDTHFERSLFGRLEALLRKLQECAELVVSTAAPLTPRHVRGKRC